ncbi:glycosyltransferase [Photobacterium swingsii]|uniref:ATP-grasp fold amidoligase family protein n=1 Tax=Photobacterium swingsii TaxID=680026 RepID=UPI003D1123CF
MKVFKKILQKMPSSLSTYIRAVYCLRYFPNFKKPKTFNEKIQHRKLTSKDDTFSLYSDKFEVKKYVKSVVGEEFLIETFYVGPTISPKIIQDTIDIKGSIVCKTTHDSGSVFLLDASSTTKEIDNASIILNQEVKNDYGKKSGELWYGKITPRIIIEKQLICESGNLADYKFHVFNHDGNTTVILHIDFDRFNNHNRSWFDEELNWLPFSMGYPNIKTNIDKPENYSKMLEVAKKIGHLFNYARVDLYNVNGQIYFGEITFAHGSGYERFSSKYHDRWMGNFWKLSE